MEVLACSFLQLTGHKAKTEPIRSPRPMLKRPSWSPKTQKENRAEMIANNLWLQPLI